MTDERREQIKEYAEKCGFSFATAIRALEEMEADDFLYEQTMAEIAY